MSLILPHGVRGGGGEKNWRSGGRPVKKMEVKGGAGEKKRDFEGRDHHFI